MNTEDTKDVKPVRYSYAFTSALLVGGAAISLLTGYPAGAQVAPRCAPEAPQASFGELEGIPRDSKNPAIP